MGAIGEGWHNFHHSFPYDYAAGEWGIDSGVWNPTKLFLDLMAALGLVTDRKRAHIVRAREAVGAGAVPRAADKVTDKAAGEPSQSSKPAKPSADERAALPANGQARPWRVLGAHMEWSAASGAQLRVQVCGRTFTLR